MMQFSLIIGGITLHIGESVEIYFVYYAVCKMCEHVLRNSFYSVVQ